MIRPWIGVLSVLVGLAALPGVAMAQDNPPPTVTITTPTDGATFTQGDVVNAVFTCTDPDGVQSCVGSTANGAPLPTNEVRSYTFSVTATDALLNSTTVTRTYTVKGKEVDVGGGAAATLSLALGTPTAFAPFTPGIAKDYLTTLSASVISTALDATLTVADTSATQTGHLLNGTYFLPKALEADARRNVTDPPPPLATKPVGGSAAPTSLLTYAGPVANDPITITFKQSIAATDALRTGAYSKLLTFTLSTTNP